MAKTLVQSTADSLIKMIREENYESGSKLPTEKDLCGRFNVGRNTIREALKILASKNIITIRRGSGSFITETPGLAKDPLGLELIDDRKQVTFDLFEVLIMLEPSVAGMAAKNATDADVAALEQLVIEMEQHVGSKHDYAILSAQFHSRLVESAHNLVLTNMKSVIESGILYYSSGLTPDSLYNNFPRTMLGYVKTRDAISATSEMRFHLLYDKHMLRKNDIIDLSED